MPSGATAMYLIRLLFDGTVGILASSCTVMRYASWPISNSSWASFSLTDSCSRLRYPRSSLRIDALS